MKDNQNIDELLNSFIDGQLGQREQVEVRRLIAHDPIVAKKLHDLRKCSDLVGALPFEEAPAGISQDIKAALERKTLLGARHSDFEERKGAVQLFMRKFVAAAAMFLLVVALGAVVYTVISPADSKNKKVAFSNWERPAKKTVIIQKAESNIVRQAAPVNKKEVVVVAETPPSDFKGRIELKVRDIVAADAYINRAFEDNSIVPQISPLAENRKLYAMTCSPENFKTFLAQMKNIWNRFDSTRLSVDDSAVAVDDVTLEQISKIAEQTTVNTQIQVAKNFSVINHMNQRLPGREVMIAVNEKQQNLSNIPKPVLASKEKPASKQTANSNGKKIHLSILIIPAK